jgi:hypothetical protein
MKLLNNFWLYIALILIGWVLVRFFLVLVAMISGVILALIGIVGLIYISFKDFKKYEEP